MIKRYKNGEWIEPGSFCQAVGIYKGMNKTVSVVGGGGKTTLIRRVMKECLEGGIPCAVSTTTHIQAIHEKYFLGDPSVELFREFMLKYGVVWMGQETTEGKLKAFPEDYIETVSKEPGILLLEADGAKHLPVKAPAVHEPVICAQTDMVWNVYGMGAVGRRIEEVCFRVEEVCKILKKDKKDMLRAEDIVTLAESRLAGRKNITDAMEYHVVLNQADTKEQERTAMQIAVQIGKNAKVHITSGLLAKKEQWR